MGYYVSKIYKKACDRLKISRMLKHQVDRNVLINIYLSFIRPIPEYGNVIWDNCTQNEANLLESVRVEAGRIITGLRVNSSRSKLYSELDWEPLYKRREKQKLILLHKIINGLTPDYMYDMIQPYTENIHDYNLRQQISGDNVRLPFCNTVSYSKISSLVRYDSGMVCLLQQSPVLLLIYLRQD
jgi:hypothetical protein